MGRKTKFIGKGAGQKFHLLHRSTTDQAYANDGVPSEFVLVAANENQANASSSRQETSSSKLDSFISSKYDHVNEFGFANDGYDYSQHLKEMGGGVFIDNSGKVSSSKTIEEQMGSMKISLPADVLPSETELQRDYHAISINPDLMDEDIRNALFQDYDEEGEFEELQDDFVLQAMQEPEEPGFDFDEHIAKLIARSEQTLGINKPRGWDDMKLNENDDDDDDDSGFFPDDTQSKLTNYKSDNQSKSGVFQFSTEEKELVESQFDKIIDDYDEDLIGALSEEEDEIDGEINLEDDPAFLQIMDEFLQDQKDTEFIEGKNVKKGLRSVELIYDPVDVEVDVKLANKEQALRQEEYKIVIEEVEESSRDAFMLETCQEYLREEKIEEEWDCETILSTYSTLDNHPSIIKDSNGKYKKYKSRHTKSLEKAEQLANLKTSTVKQSAVPIKDTNIKDQIILKGKLGLPVEEEDIKSKIYKDPIIMEEDENIDESDDDDESKLEKEQNDKDIILNKRSKNESKEEKKLRKSMIKVERKQKRSMKKSIKLIHRAEESKVLAKLGKEQSIDRVSVFKY